MSDTQQRIDELVKNNEITLFMKGNASFPMCGFSGRAIQILKAVGVDPKTVTRWAKAGKLTSIRTLGGHRRYRAAEVRALLGDIPGQRGAGDAVDGPAASA